MNEINDVYLKVDELFKIKLKSQIKGSGLIFDKLLYVNDIVKEISYYFLFLNDDGFTFNTLDELYDGLTRIINKELKQIEDETKHYQYHMMKDLTYDEAFIHNELDGLGYRESKLLKILKQIEKNRIRQITTANRIDG